VLADLDPMRKLWQSAKQHVDNDVAWLQSPLPSVNAEEAERTANDVSCSALSISLTYRRK
jgi:hypothetical protein